MGFSLNQPALRVRSLSKDKNLQLCNDNNGINSIKEATILLIKEIAGINFAVNYPQSVVLKEHTSSDESFLMKANFELETIDIQIYLELKKTVSVEGLTMIFDSGQSWSLFRDMKNYHLLQAHPRDQCPLWLARFDSDVEQVIVYYTDKMPSEQDGITTLANPVCYPLDQLLLMYFLSGREGALFHAAGADMGGRGFIFPGKSGAGKSTFSRRFLTGPGPGSGIAPLSDDRMVVRKIDGVFYAFGTPWPGDAGIAVNKGAPLEGIFFIHHGTKDRVKEITSRQAFERLMPVTSIPWYDREVMPRVLDFCEDMVNHVPAFDLYFQLTSDAPRFPQGFPDHPA